MTVRKEHPILFTGGSKTQTRRLVTRRNSVCYSLPSTRFAELDLSRAWVDRGHPDNAFCTDPRVSYLQAPLVTDDDEEWHRVFPRIDLLVTRVRVERLQDITEEDARAEGVVHGPIAARAMFRALWDSINSKRGPWDSNPWVWVYEREREA